MRVCAPALRDVFEQAVVPTTKRIFDILFVLAGSVVAVPLAILVAAVIRVMDGSPVFYSHLRVGLGGTPFTMYKFRTMRTDAESGNAVWAVQGDPRCTRLGSVLRSRGLDEVPQLWNVRRGVMSLVGPWPEREVFAADFIERFPEYGSRFEVLPGITGYAQIHGWRGDTSVEGRLRHDLYYLRNRSVALDLYVLFGTFYHAWRPHPRDGVGG
jgi:lipopolysaccharide/colanic/teichoic acid biosynthesis glycosyltransferase